MLSYDHYIFFINIERLKTLPIISVESNILDGWFILKDLVGHVFALVPALFLAGLLGGRQELGHLLGLLVQGEAVFVVRIKFKALSEKMVKVIKLYSSLKLIFTKTKTLNQNTKSEQKLHKIHINMPMHCTLYFFLKINF